MVDDENVPKGLPLTWYLALLSLIFFGVLLSWLDVLEISPLSAIKANGRQLNWSRLLGVYLVAVPISHLVITFALAGTTHLFRLEGSHLRHRLWPPAIIGILEAVMYPTSLLMERPEFIGLWLALKVAGQWGWWTVDDKDEEKVHQGRRRYYQSLIGNGLSVLCGAGTYLGILLLAVKPAA